ncbi:hypothetical protein BS50DRAFT_153083 [Corynespora cassiicola Philippines]|uniref:Uncharacterized protein n=1 Tax=Corynespora cassiicola Philippines TaxID=1448308 RepID=A0A2T2N7W7_CORCC|nr:hypothetical protein BS50DRAFT_153083 [Corynespora cassiicola Philippines]
MRVCDTGRPRIINMGEENNFGTKNRINSYTALYESYNELPAVRQIESIAEGEHGGSSFNRDVRGSQLHNVEDNLQSDIHGTNMNESTPLAQHDNPVIRNTTLAILKTAEFLHNFFINLVIRNTTLALLKTAEFLQYFLINLVIRNAVLALLKTAEFLHYFLINLVIRNAILAILKTAEFLRYFLAIVLRTTGMFIVNFVGFLCSALGIFSLLLTLGGIKLYLTVQKGENPVIYLLIEMYGFVALAIFGRRSQLGEP